MNCGENTIKYLLFIFNFIFTLCGLALIIPAVIIYVNIKDVSTEMQENVIFPVIAIIIIGSIIFVIAFFGCCGAIRDSHCMIVTFAILLLSILVAQIAIAILAFIKLKGFDRQSFDHTYEEMFNDYWKEDKKQDRIFIDLVQTALSCCGIEGPDDFSTSRPGFNGSVPMSCCPIDPKNHQQFCSQPYSKGCSENVAAFFQLAGKLLGGIALGIAGVELIGIIFALCFANSIRNADRRAYRV
ncbi:CD63 antigen-like isoform X2 [Cotesia glomerata]|uniref:CD63 antigen-like isoform X2 n=1 Tax=Cotesia glomerata TaxID=32391 RepID=UPI001D0148E5|nr:CD63 antigen-like isoform X2 [Cotesia glomerata]